MKTIAKTLEQCQREIANAHKRVQFPECRDFASLFASVAQIPDYASVPRERAHEWTTDETDYLPGGKVRHRKGCCVLSRFCSVDARRLGDAEPSYFGLDVTPTTETLAAIEGNMLISDRDCLNFRAIVRDSGSLLVTCDYSLISGGCWLAIVPATTLPRTRAK